MDFEYLELIDQLEISDWLEIESTFVAEESVEMADLFQASGFDTDGAFLAQQYVDGVGDTADMTDTFAEGDLSGGDWDANWQSLSQVNEESMHFQQSQEMLSAEFTPGESAIGLRASTEPAMGFWEEMEKWFVDIMDFWTPPPPQNGLLDEQLVPQSDFSADGTWDNKNNLIVEGNVASDISFLSMQTHGSCSLMAQEQFVHRYYGNDIPEEYLEHFAAKWGVYDPNMGTNYDGQTMILEYCNIPFERTGGNTIEDLNQAVMEGKDVLIGVNAREFYGDPMSPPFTPDHAVAVVGRGTNPDTGELAGFYVTDSNCPGNAHFISVEKMGDCWFDGDMITVPPKAVA